MYYFDFIKELYKGKLPKKFCKRNMVRFTSTSVYKNALIWPEKRVGANVLGVSRQIVVDRANRIVFIYFK